MKDTLLGLAVIGVYISGLLLWMYGIASAYDNGNTFMAVVNLVVFPVGVIYGFIEFFF